MSVCLCSYHTIISNFISFHISTPARQSSCINFRNGKFPFYLSNSVNERTNNVCMLHTCTHTDIYWSTQSSGIDDFPFLKNCLGDFHYEKSFLSSFFQLENFHFNGMFLMKFDFYISKKYRNVKGNIISRKILYSTPWSADTCICLTHIYVYAGVGVAVLRREAVGCCAAWGSRWMCVMSRRRFLFPGLWRFIQGNAIISQCLGHPYECRSDSPNFSKLNKFHFLHSHNLRDGERNTTRIHVLKGKWENREN